MSVENTSATGNSPKSDLRSLQILKDPNRHADLAFQSPDCCDGGRMNVMFAMAEIQPEGINPLVEQAAQHERRGAGWPNSCNDLGASFADHGMSFG